MHSSGLLVPQQPGAAAALPAAHTEALMNAVAPHVTARSTRSGGAAAMHLCPVHIQQEHQVMPLNLHQQHAQRKQLSLGHPCPVPEHLWVLGAPAVSCSCISVSQMISMKSCECAGRH